MLSFAKILRFLAAVAGLSAAGVATTAHAQATACGIQGISGQAAPAVYDPFNPSGFQSSTIVMNITRINPGGGAKTDIVNFYLKASPATGTAANGIEIRPLSISGQASMEGSGLNIFYDTPVTPPTLLPAELSPSGGNRFMKVTFNGNAGSADTVSVTFQVNIPANLSLNASQTLAFDAEYACKMSGGAYNKQTQVGSRSDALSFPVTTLSALRTYYAGTALAFGDISTVPPVPPAPVRTSPSNYIFVQSSGAYEVSLSSQNAFKMKRPSATGPNEEIRYSLKFLGDTRDNTTTPTPGAVAINHSCVRAGLATAGQQLPIQATLQEGGQGKNPGIDYQDILTVTITPLAYAILGTDNCGGYSVP